MTTQGLGNRALATIPASRTSASSAQVSPQSAHGYSFSMRFADRAAYEAYNTHPVHVAFVRDRWAHEVIDFQELDFVALDTND